MMTDFKLEGVKMDPMDPPMKWAIRIWGFVLLAFGIAYGWHLHKMIG